MKPQDSCSHLWNCIYIEHLSWCSAFQIWKKYNHVCEFTFQPKPNNLLIMGKYGQLIMGPAGAGKSTYCNALQQHCENAGRTVHIANLDPAAEVFNYTASIGSNSFINFICIFLFYTILVSIRNCFISIYCLDIRELITVDDVMEEFGFGPNGALLYRYSHHRYKRNILNDI